MEYTVKVQSNGRFGIYLGASLIEGGFFSRVAAHAVCDGYRAAAKARA